MGQVKSHYWDEIEAAEEVSDAYVSPLDRMKEMLGTNWVLHPQYKFRPRHSNNEAVWKKHSVLADVRNRAIVGGRI